MLSLRIAREPPRDFSALSTSSVVFARWSVVEEEDFSSFITGDVTALRTLLPSHSSASKPTFGVAAAASAPFGVAASASSAPRFV